MRLKMDLIGNSFPKIMYTITFKKSIQFIIGKDGGGGLFARGYCTTGKELIDSIMDKLRVQCEKCDHFSGF
jgi:hypothetical protein